MRLWHKDLLKVLPQKQICSQWRECCAIAKSIKEKGTPNHILVNKIMNYPIEQFLVYTATVEYEMIKRGYKVNSSKFSKYFDSYYIAHKSVFDRNTFSETLFPNWHNDRYYRQCYFNLQEKFDCGGITREEWDNIQRAYYDKYPLGVENI